MAGFKSAFAAARKAGKKEFTWNGKRYNTKLASDTPKSVPTPTDNPAKKKSGASRSASGKKSPTSGASRSSEGKVEAGKVKDVVNETKRHIARSGASQKASGKKEGFLSKFKRTNRQNMGGVANKKYKLGR